MHGVSPTRPSTLFSIPPVDVAHATFPSLSTATAPTVPIFPLYQPSGRRSGLRNSADGFSPQWKYLTFGTPQGRHPVPGSSSSASGRTQWWETPGTPLGYPWTAQTDWRPPLSDTHGLSKMRGHRIYLRGASNHFLVLFDFSADWTFMAPVPCPSPVLLAGLDWLNYALQTPHHSPVSSHPSPGHPSPRLLSHSVQTRVLEHSLGNGDV